MDIFLPCYLTLIESYLQFIILSAKFEPLPLLKLIQINKNATFSTLIYHFKESAVAMKTK